MSYLKRRESSSSPEQVSGSFAGSADDSARFPALVEFLSAIVWPGGDARLTGTLLLFVEDGKLKGCLNDRDQGVVSFFAAESLLGAVQAAEKVLGSGNGDWRPQRRGKR